MTTPSILWSARSGNRKTGDVPTAWIGATRDASKASCTGCPLLGNGCYAQSPGLVATGHHSVIKGYQNGPERYSLSSALAKRAKSARMVRLSAIGDVGLLGAEVAASVVATVKAAGLAIVGYTHHWRNPAAAPWKGQLMASCETLTDVDTALSRGWRATVVTPEGLPRSYKTPGGHTVVQCPATLPSVTVKCNECRLCDANKPGPIVAFPVHGNGKRKALSTIVDGNKVFDNFT